MTSPKIDRTGRNKLGGKITASIDHGRMGMQLLTNAWNKDYTKKLAARGPATLKACNLGTSFLVAPMNHTDPRVRKG